MKLVRKAAAAWGLVLWIAGCGSSQAVQEAPSTAPRERVELIVSAAASLQASMKEIAEQYGKRHPEVNVRYNFASSGALQQQIEQGAPVDLFVFAGRKQMDALVKEQLVDETQRTVLLANSLVAVVPLDDKSGAASMEHLNKAEIKKIAVGEVETVPAGRYTQESLGAYKLWEPLQSKLIYAKDVTQVLTYVETGNADLGFVYKTDAMTSRNVKVAFAVDEASHSPIEYPAGVVKAAKHPREAAAFYDYLQGQEATDIFTKHGFAKPKRK